MRRNPRFHVTAPTSGADRLWHSEIVAQIAQNFVSPIHKVLAMQKPARNLCALDENFGDSVGWEVSDLSAAHSRRSILQTVR